MLPPGQNTPRSSQIATSPSTVAWSDGTYFDGFIWIGIALPTSKAFDYPFLFASTRLQRLPQFIKIPIINGAVDQTTQIFFSADINPAGTQYVAYFFSSDGTLIAPASGTATPFTVTASPTTLTVPTLTLPTSPTNPVPQT